MESKLQKWGWIAHLLVIAVAAVLLANAVTKFVAIQLAPYTVPTLPKLATSPGDAKKAPAKPIARTLSRGIVDRCLFGCEEAAPPPSECPDGCPEGQVCQEGACVAAAEEVPSELLVASDIGAKLLGAMVAADPDFSVALFSDPAAKATYILGVGDTLMGQAEVIDIRRDRVVLKRNGRLEYIRLENSLAGAPTLTSTVANLPPGATDIKRLPSSVPKERPIPPKEVPAALSAAPNKPVEEVSPGVYTLDQAAVNAELDDPKKLAQAAKVVPNYVDGQPAGIKLVGVRSDSVYSQLGIESGDVVTSINGTKVKNQAHAFELMQKLRNAKNATIEIERRGDAKTLKYNVK